MKSVGIDIGTYSVAVAEIESSSKSYGITGFKEFKLSQKAGADHELEIIEILREVAKVYDPESTRFTFGVHQDAVSLRHKFFPFKERSKVLKSLPFELEDEIPLNSDEVVYDARILSYRGNFSEVLAVACPKSEILKIMNLARDSGIDPDIISIESLAFGNLFEEWHLPPPALPALDYLNFDDDEEDLEDEEDVQRPIESANLVLHIGHQRTLVCVMKDKQMIQARTILWGARDVAEKLSKNYSVSVGEAIEMLPSKAFVLMTSVGATKQQIQLSQTISDSINELSKEIKRIILDLQTNYHLTIQYVDLLGGTSNIKNIGPYLTQKLEIPVNLFKHFDVYNNISIPKTPENESASPIAIGLAIEGLKKASNPPINLRKLEFAKKNRSFEQTWARWGYTIRLSGALLLLFIIFGFIKGSMVESLTVKAEDNLRQQAQKVAKLSKSKSKPRLISRHIKDQEKKIAAAKSLSNVKDIKSAVSVLARVSQSLPLPRTGFGNSAKPLYEVRKMNINYDVLEVEGVIFNSNIQPQILNALKNVAIGGKVTTQRSVLATKPGERSFSYRMKVKRTL